MEDKVDNAMFFMIDAHKGQKRWNGDPYSNHPRDVVIKLTQMGVEDEDILAAGYLHDIVEDTDYTIGDINRLFGSRVAKIVEELTFDQTDKSESTYWSKCKEMGKEASLIKIADIISNLSDDGKKSNRFIQKRMGAMLILMRNLK